MATLALPIQSIERRLRGGTQALLVRDESGNAYVAKCVGNPQGTRTLINEWIVSRLLQHLRVSTPEVRALRFERGIPGDNLLEFQTGNRRTPVPDGVHFGSLCPVDPERKAIFDFLPRRLLHKVVNLPDLLMAYVFDKWVHQMDSRQAIFIRERSAESSGLFRAYLIDHGLSFGGSRWELQDTGLAGLYQDRSIYGEPEFEAAAHDNVDRIQQLSDTDLFLIENEIPAEWLQREDRGEMTRLLELLCDRRAGLHDTIDRAVAQLQQAGIVLPKTAANRRLLAALLLMSSLPASVSTIGAHFKVAVSAARASHPAVDVRFSTHSETGQPINGCSVRLWSEKRIHKIPVMQNEAPAEDRIYRFRVYPSTADESEDQPAHEYAFVPSDAPATQVPSSPLNN